MAGNVSHRCSRVPLHRLRKPPQSRQEPRSQAGQDDGAGKAAAPVSKPRKLMAASPQIVTQETAFTWDGAPQRLPRGQILDVQPGSALEAAIGRERLAPLFARPAAPPAEAAAQPPGAAQPAEADDDAGKTAAARSKPRSAPQAATAAKAAPVKDGSDGS